MRTLALIGIFSVMVALLTGCGGGLVGETGYEVAFKPAQANLDSGWEDFDAGSYASAYDKFMAVLNQEHSRDQEIEANLGAGWAKLKLDGFDAARSYFEAASTEAAAKIALAADALVRADKDDIEYWLGELERLGYGNPNATLSLKHNFGITNARLHALMALLYYYAGDTASASAHAQAAGILNNPEAESQAIDDIADWLGG